MWMLIKMFRFLFWILFFVMISEIMARTHFFVAFACRIWNVKMKLIIGWRRISESRAG